MKTSARQGHLGRRARSGALILAFFGLIGTTSAQAKNYYVSEGPGTPVFGKTGDPNAEVEVVEWQIRLYANSEVAGAGIPWGSITAKTYEGVMTKLKAAQNFQKAYAAWCHMDYTTEKLTYFNPFGPIAVLKPSKASGTESMDRVLAATKKVAELKKKFFALYKLYLKSLKLPSTSMKKVGKVLSEYADNLSAAEKRVHELYRNLDYSIDVRLQTLETDLADLEKSMVDMTSFGSKAAIALTPREGEINSDGEVTANTAERTAKRTGSSSSRPTDQDQGAGSAKSSADWSGGVEYASASIQVLHGGEMVAVFVCDALARPKGIDHGVFVVELKGYLAKNLAWVKRFGIVAWEDNGKWNRIDGGAPGDKTHFELRVPEDSWVEGSASSSTSRTKAIWNYLVESHENDPWHPLPTFCVIEYLGDGAFTFTESTNIPWGPGYRARTVAVPADGDAGRQDGEAEPLRPTHNGAGNAK